MKTIHVMGPGGDDQICFDETTESIEKAMREFQEVMKKHPYSVFDATDPEKPVRMDSASISSVTQLGEKTVLVPQLRGG